MQIQKVKSNFQELTYEKEHAGYIREIVTRRYNFDFFQIRKKNWVEYQGGTVLSS